MGGGGGLMLVDLEFMRQESMATLVRGCFGARV